MVSLLEDSFGEAVTAKPFGRLVETVFKLKKNDGGIQEAMKEPPQNSSRDVTFRLLLSALVLTLLGIALVSFFLIREFSKHQQTLRELGQAEQARLQLEQSLAQIRSGMTRYEKRVERLGLELEKATAKAAFIDQLRRDHEAELARMQALYEAQVKELRKLLESRDNLVNRLQSQWESVRSRIPEGSGAGLLGETRPFAKTQGVSAGTAPEAAPLPHKRISGKVALVDRENRFIIVTFGGVDGAVVGDFVKIYQEGRPLGDGRIERVYHHLSAATVTSEDTLSRVQKGDSVFLSFF